MATMYRFAAIWPHFIMFATIILVYAVYAGFMVACGKAVLPLDPSLIHHPVIALTAPNIVLSFGWYSLILTKLRDYVSLPILLIVYAASIPVSIWAMSQGPIPMAPADANQDTKFYFSVRRLLYQPFYRTLYLFHFGLLLAPGPKLWIGPLCDLTATLGHLVAATIFYDLVSHKPGAMSDALGTCILAVQTAVGVASLLSFEKPAQAILESGLNVIAESPDVSKDREPIVEKV